MSFDQDWNDYLTIKDGDMLRFRGISYAQTGEDLIIERIFEAIGTTNRQAIDLGAGDGWNLSNVRRFLDAGWSGILVDGGQRADDVHQLWIDARTIAGELRRLGALDEPDLLSVDLDGQDYWVVRAILKSKIRPRALCLEYNASRDDSVTVPFDPAFAHDGTTYYGCTLLAYEKLLHKYGYVVVHQHWHRNLFVVRSEYVAIRPEIDRSRRRWHLPDTQNRPWVAV